MNSRHCNLGDGDGEGDAGRGVNQSVGVCVTASQEVDRQVEDDVGVVHQVEYEIVVVETQHGVAGDFVIPDALQQDIPLPRYIISKI